MYEHLQSWYVQQATKEMTDEFLWKWKRTTRLEGEQPAVAIRSPRAEARNAGPLTSPSRRLRSQTRSVLPAFTSPPPGVSLERSFCQDGFVVVPQVFDQTEIAELRRAAIALFPDNRPPFEPKFSNTALYREPFRLIFRKPKLIQALRAVLGDDFVFINEFALHDFLLRRVARRHVLARGQGGP